VCAEFYVVFGSWKNILLGNYSFIDFWSYHLRALSLASEVHGLVGELHFALTLYIPEQVTKSAFNPKKTSWHRGLSALSSSRLIR
jgi:hypothetical protein